jgi:hypothetical protein
MAPIVFSLDKSTVHEDRYVSVIEPGELRRLIVEHVRQAIPSADEESRAIVIFSGSGGETAQQSARVEIVVDRTRGKPGAASS